MPVRPRTLAALVVLLAGSLLVALPAATAATGGAAAVTPAGPTAPLSSLRLVECRPDQGRALFHVHMRATPRTARMAMRLTLLERLPGSRFSPVHAPGLDRWRDSRRGVQSFGVRQAVRNLAPGAVYRLEARLRWYDRRGGVLRRARKRSQPCRDPAQLPNLRVYLLGARPYAWGKTDYALGVGNVGATRSRAAPLVLSVGGTQLAPVRVGPLAPGAWRRIVLRGPACAGAVVAMIDPADVVVELDEADNSHELSCSELLE